MRSRNRFYEKPLSAFMLRRMLDHITARDA